MNYLAHLLLSFQEPGIVTGQFIADDVKGNKYLQYEPVVRDGILLHRFVDDFTDNHPECLKLRAMLRGDLGLFTPVAMDVFFDHILAVHWEKYSEINLEEFIAQHYNILDSNRKIMSPMMNFVLDKMIERNWLGRYRDTEGIELTLREMSGRIRLPNNLHLAAQTLKNQTENIDNTFHQFFPKLLVGAKTKFNTFATYPPK